MKKINPGEFRHRIQIQRYDEYKNDDNIPCEGWIDLFSTKAKVINVRGDDFILAQGNGVRITKTFYIRARKEFEVTEEDRIIYNGREFNIKYVNDIEERGIYLEIKAEVIENGTSIKRS